MLFDEGEFVCTTNPPKGMESTVVSPLAAADFNNQYVCINPLDGSKDNEPLYDWHHASRPRRADANVTCFRSFLVEFDERELVDQVDYVQSIGMPYSLLTYSGGKSFHFIISLSEPCESARDYRETVERLYAAVGGKAAGLDMSTKNPSRLSRTPNAYRLGTDVQQALLDVKSRVPRSVLEEWLASRGHSLEALAKRKAALSSSRSDVGSSQPMWRGLMHSSTLNFLLSGAARGEWNISFFKATCDLVRCGYTEDEIFRKMEDAHGPLEFVTVNTIRSAIRKALHDKENEEDC